MENNHDVIIFYNNHHYEVISLKCEYNFFFRHYPGNCYMLSDAIIIDDCFGLDCHYYLISAKHDPKYCTCRDNPIIKKLTSALNPCPGSLIVEKYVDGFQQNCTQLDVEYLLASQHSYKVSSIIKSLNHQVAIFFSPTEFQLMYLDTNPKTFVTSYINNCGCSNDTYDKFKVNGIRCSYKLFYGIHNFNICPLRLRYQTQRTFQLIIEKIVDGTKVNCYPEDIYYIKKHIFNNDSDVKNKHHSKSCTIL